MKSKLHFKSTLVGMALGLTVAFTIGATTGENEVSNEYHKTPAGKDFELIQRDADGKITWWGQRFYDYDGKERLLILKNPHGEITDLNVMCYNADDNISEYYWFKSNGQLHRGMFYDYNGDGSWKGTYFKDESGKKRGTVLTKDEDYMYGEKGRTP